MGMDCPLPEELPVRDRLLNAAEAVVARDGVSNLTLETVAREAGVSKGGLLYHFPSKSALISAIVERLGERCQRDQARVLAGDTGKPGAFARAYLAIRSEPVDPQTRPMHIALLAAAGTDPQYLEPFRRRLVEWQQRLEADGIDPVTATVVRLAIDGLGLMSLLGLPGPEGELRQKVIERLREMTEIKPENRSGT
jgi:AcrR family transcriptional regulator